MTLDDAATLYILLHGPVPDLAACTLEEHWKYWTRLGNLAFECDVVPIELHWRLKEIRNATAYPR